MFISAFVGNHAFAHVGELLSITEGGTHMHTSVRLAVSVYVCKCVCVCHCIKSVILHQ